MQIDEYNYVDDCGGRGGVICCQYPSFIPFSGGFSLQSNTIIFQACRSGTPSISGGVWWGEGCKRTFDIKLILVCNFQLFEGNMEARGSIS